jgi:hypothetical protein
MTQSFNKLAQTGGLECFQCEEHVQLGELLAVDDLINESPFLAGLSENFGLCTGTEHKFHGSVVNCCTACYALIVQPMALWDDGDRVREIRNVARVLRGASLLPAMAAINMEHLLAALLDMDPRSPVPADDVAEALYLTTSPHWKALEMLIQSTDLPKSIERKQKKGWENASGKRRWLKAPIKHDTAFEAGDS